MGEITVNDIGTFTKDRLDPSDPEVARMLAAALVVARRECGWHVSPVRTNQTVTLDGPGSRILWLPSMKVVQLNTISEDGVDLDTDYVSISVGTGDEMLRRVALRKRGAGWWTAEYGAIEINMDHGLTEAQAADWREAIMSMVDAMSLLPVSSATGGGGLGLKSERIDDIAYTFDSYASMAEEVLFSFSHVLCGYKLAPVEF